MVQKGGQVTKSIIVALPLVHGFKLKQISKLSEAMKCVSPVFGLYG